MPAKILNNPRRSSKNTADKIMQKIGAVNITVEASPNGINNTEMNMKMIMPAAHTPWKQKKNESDTMALDFFFSFPMFITFGIRFCNH